MYNLKTNATMMDFIMHNFGANLTAYDDNYLEANYNLHFDDAEIVSKGTKVKVLRDIW